MKITEQFNQYLKEEAELVVYFTSPDGLVKRPVPFEGYSKFFTDESMSDKYYITQEQRAFDKDGKLMAIQVYVTEKKPIMIEFVDCVDAFVRFYEEYGLDMDPPVALQMMMPMSKAFEAFKKHKSKSHGDICKKVYEAVMADLRSMEKAGLLNQENPEASQASS